MNPTFDPLCTFFDWFFKSPIHFLGVPDGGLRNYGTVLGCVLYQQDEFQVELFIAPPGEPGVPIAHRHPRMDSYEVYLYGDLYFLKDPDKKVVETRLRSVDTTKSFSPSAKDRLQRVTPTDWHGSVVGPRGGAFFSVQHWLGVPPSSAGLDWEGEMDSQEHVNRLNSHAKYEKVK